MSAIHERILASDGAAINRVLSSHGVKARFPNSTSSMARSNAVIALNATCLYGLKKAPEETIKNIERLSRELSLEISTSRKKYGLKAATSFRLLTTPSLAIEVDSPVDYRLSYGGYNTKPFVSPIGAAYDFQGQHDIEYTLDHYHTLVAALSGHGKSTLLRSMLLGYLENTSPEDLIVGVIDLKNSDFAEFSSMPHVQRFATSGWDEARGVIGWLNSIKEARREKGGVNKPIVLLVIDEMAELITKGPECDRMLEELTSCMNLGRSLGIRTIAATQYANAKTIGDGPSRAFTHRIIGRVDSAKSASVVSGRTGTGAEQLARPGSWLFVDGGKVRRFQAYNDMRKLTTERLVASSKWPQVHELKSGVVLPKSGSKFDQAVNNCTRYRAHELKSMKKKDMYDLMFGVDGWHSNTYYKNMAIRVLEYIE